MCEANNVVDLPSEFEPVDLERAEAGNTQQLVARLKRTCKYYGQTEPGVWFDVRVVNDRSYHLRGNSNNYRLSDVVLGMRLDGGTVIDLATGKSNRPRKGNG